MRLTRSRRGPLHLILPAALALAACSADRGLTGTSPSDTPTDPAVAAQQFDHVADSITVSAGAEAAAPYRGMADLLRQGGRVSSVKLTIDGQKDIPFTAVAQETILTGSGCPVASLIVLSPNGGCPTLMPTQTRLLLAWQTDRPTRLVQLVANGEAGAIGSFSQPTPATFVPSFMQYVDGKSGLYWATAGSQANAMKLTGKSCPVATAGPRRDAKAPECNEADFTWKFDATLGVPPIPIRGNTATGTHTLSLASSPVAGVQVRITMMPPPPPPPPPPLVGTLRATVDSLVTLTFVVQNTTAEKVDVRFNTGQRYDFVIVDRDRKEVWRWSKDRGFTQALTSVTIPARGSVAYTEKWKPTAKGHFLAMALLTSTSHKLVAHTELDVR